MTTYTTIADSEIDPESPYTTTLATKNRDNPIAQGEGDSTVPAAQRNCKHLIATATASASATIDFSNVIDGTYEHYVVELINVVPATDAVDLRIRVETGGSTWQTGSVYIYGSVTAAFVPATLTNGISNVAAEGGASLNVHIYDPSSGSNWTHLKASASSWLGDSGNHYSTLYGGAYTAITAVTGIRFYMSSGNVASGEFRLYGVSA